MRQAKLVAPRRIEIEEVPFTPSPAAGEAVVQVKAVGICGTDLHVFQGHRADVVLPRVMGHELSGVVTHTGAGVDQLVPGDRVILDPVFSCGKCPVCKKGRGNVCADVKCFGVQMEGGLKDYITVPAHRLYKIPDHVTMEQAALGEPYSIAANITGRTGMAAGEKAVVIGAGTIGQTLVQVLASAGVSVLVSDVVDYKLKVAEGLGASYTVNSRTGDLTEAVKDFAPGGADIVIDAVGISPLTELAFSLAASTARIGVIGFDERPMAIPPVSITKRELTVVGSRMNAGQFPKVVGWLSEKSITPQALITGTYAFEDVQSAFEDTLAHPDTCIKTIIQL